MATPVKVILVWEFTYRGNPEEWSLDFHFDGANPADADAWRALINALRDEVKACVTSDVVFMRGYGYNIDATSVSFVYDQSASTLSFRQGTLAVGSTVPAPGDCATTVRWKTAETTTKGKPIYLRKYLHGVRLPSTGGDAPASTQITAMEGMAGAMTDASLPDGRTIVGPRGAHGNEVQVSPWVTTRTLKRRGRRPPPP